MATTQPPATYSGELFTAAESPRSAVSWAAVLAGAAIATALSAMLILGGGGLGFLAVSPWQGEGASGTTLAVGSIVWLIVVQIIAYGVAGYVTGRLRTRWTDAASDEIHFRDTAHGLLLWAVSAIIGMALLGSGAASVVSGAASAGATLLGSGAGAAGAVAGQKVDTASSDFSLDYFTDTLLRPQDPSATGERGDVKKEVSGILTTGMAKGGLSEADRSYLGKLVAQRTGLDEAAAQQRIKQIEGDARKAADEAEQKAREAADAARKAAAKFTLWAFASLLIGAFVASLAATVGGRARNR